MEEANAPVEWSKVKNYVDRLTEVQNSIRELNLDSRQIRTQARDDGLNFEVVATLSQIRSNNPHDDGEKFFNLLIKYAQHTGIRLKNVPDGIDNEPEREAGNKTDAEMRPLSIDHAVYAEREDFLGDRTRVFLQFAVAMGVSLLFLWLLH